MAKTAFIVEDEFLIADYLHSLCEDLGVKVLGEASDGSNTAQRILALSPEYVLMDVRLSKGPDGVDIAQEVHQRRSDIKVIFITGSNEPPTLARIRAGSPHRILIKPVQVKDLAEAFGID